MHQKTFVACQNHMPEHQRAPNGTTMWLQHTWGPRFRRGTMGHMEWHHHKQATDSNQMAHITKEHIF